MVTERQNEILNLIIDIFTKTHEPVGSKALQESIQSSSATIRNDMAVLEKQGLLEKRTHQVDANQVLRVFNTLSNTPFPLIVLLKMNSMK